MVESNNVELVGGEGGEGGGGGGKNGARRVERYFILRDRRGRVAKGLMESFSLTGFTFWKRGRQAPPGGGPFQLFCPLNVVGEKVKLMFGGNLPV